jgi:hypothetical protein
MNANLFFPSLMVACLTTGIAVAVDNSPSAVPSKGEDRKIERAAGEEVGRSAVDGITISGKQAFVTRNGKTDELMDELVLDDGTRVFPDGTIRTAGGKMITLNQDQVLRFNGKIAVAPIKEAVKSSPVIVAPPPLTSDVSTVTGAGTETTTTTSREITSSGGTIGSPGVIVGGTGTSFTTVPFVVAPGTTIQGNALSATTVTRDPSTGQLVYSAVNPATGQVVTTTTDIRTNQSISTTTINGQQISTTTNPKTGLPVTITTDSTGRSTATTVDPTTGQSVPVQYNSTTGQITGAPTANTPSTTLQTQPGNLQQNPPTTTQQGQNQQSQPGTTTQQGATAQPGTQTQQPPTTGTSGSSRSGASGASGSSGTSRPGGTSGGR